MMHGPGPVRIILTEGAHGTPACLLHLGATEQEIAETLDIGLLMGGTLAAKSVRHAFWVMEELKKRT